MNIYAVCMHKYSFLPRMMNLCVFWRYLPESLECFCTQGVRWGRCGWDTSLSESPLFTWVSSDLGRCRQKIKKWNVAAFIRVINGIDRKKALEKYATFINGADLNAEQEQYLKNILDYISVNGDMELSDFMEYPLKHYRWRDVFGSQFVSLKDFVKEMHQVIEVIAWFPS